MNRRVVHRVHSAFKEIKTDEIENEEQGNWTNGLNVSQLRESAAKTASPAQK